jgi:hypothetical protein
MTGRYQVVRLYSHRDDETPYCTHRWEWVAALCAIRRERSHPDETGCHYTVRTAGQETTP